MPDFPDAMPKAPRRIEAAALDALRLTPDGARLVLDLSDAAGGKMTLSLPASSLDALLQAMPPSLPRGAGHALETWTMTPAENGRDVILTLRTSEGLALSLAVTSWQAESMATLVAFRRRDGRTKSLH